MKMITNPEVAAIAEELERRPELMDFLRNYEKLSDDGKAQITEALINYFHKCRSTGNPYSSLDEMEQDFRAMAATGGN